MKITINREDFNDDQIIYLKHREVTLSDDEFHNAWEYESEGTKLILIENMDGAIIKIEKSENITTKDDYFIEQFIEQKQKLIETESVGIEFDDEEVPEKEPQPYDPEQIRVDTKPFSLKQTFELIQEGDIDLSPDFQRHFVWKEIKQRSRLIESIMLRIPLPVFYLAQDQEGVFQIIDGMQRLTVIKQFLNNEFKLKNLEYLKDCENMYFDKEGTKDNLDSKYVRRITQAQLIMNIIDPQTPMRVKFEIFKRINQGGKPLRPQEIRNCMASATIRNLINELASSEQFQKATDYSVNPMRMEDQELILRFIGFYYVEFMKKGSFTYSGYMESFLDTTLDMLNKETTANLETIKQAFIGAMNNAYHLFGAFAFRKCMKEHFEEGARKQFINKSLFTTWSVLLSKFDYNNLSKIIAANALNGPLAREIEENEHFYDAITNGTNDQSRLNESFKTAKKLIANNIEVLYNVN